MDYYIYSFNKLIMLFFVIIPCSLFATEPMDRFAISKAKEKTISLNFQAIKVRAALQLLAEFSGFNIIVDDKVQSELSLNLSNIPWEQALDTILQVQGLAKRPIKNGWFVATEDTFLQLDKKKQEVLQQMQALEPLISQLIAIRYADAAELASLLKDKHNAFLSRGSVSVDKRTNSLWVQESKEKLVKIGNAIKKLDRPIEQVAIEARIVSLDKNKERELGVRLGLSQLSSKAAPKIATALANDEKVLLPLNMDLPLTLGSKATSGSLCFHLLRMGQHVLLDLELSALEDEGRARIISAPHLITEDQKEATIASGEAIPYQEKSVSGDSNLVFKEAVLSLTVTPRILPDRRLMLTLGVQQDQPSKLMVSGAPAIQKRGIKTQVIVKNGETVILGGIYEDAENQRTQRIPLLGALPFIGNLFSYKEISYKHIELLIFVTPTIIDS
jgi:type IV pilus assembly protein PilQ